MAEDAPEALLAALDPEQREVALATRGPVCVIAGAGTGKTRAIAHRIAYAVRTGVVQPGHVLAVTFTTRAAGELRARLRELTSSGGAADPAAGRTADTVTARTFHAAALRQLRHFWPTTVGGVPPAVTASKIALLSEAARAGGVQAGVSDLRDVAAEIEWSKVSQIRPDDYAAAAAQQGREPPLAPETVASLYSAYEELRRSRHLVDFESVLELTAAILTEDKAAGAAVRDRYRYFVVDEFQDVNPLQKLLLDAWLGGRDDLCVVGDPGQAIYSFTGATPAYLTGFTRQFPHAAALRLVRNYRSSPQVVALANRLTEPSAALVAQRDGGPPPEFREYPDETAESAAVAARAQQLIRAGTAPRQIAILLRTNAQTERFERALADAGIACQVRGAERFFERPEVRQAMGLLRAAAKVTSAAGRPEGGVGTAASDSGAVAETRQVLAGLGLTREPPAARGASRDRWESLTALAQLAEDICAARPAAGLTDVAAELAHRAAIEHAPEVDAVTVASLHSAKGLEWDVVFLPGLTEGNLPIIHADTDAAVAEELRLLYVGLTRARQRLLLSWPLARSPGGRQARSPSRFLDVLRSRQRGRPRPAPGAVGVPAPAGYRDAVLAPRAVRPAQRQGGR